MTSITSARLRVADEVFIATALLHVENLSRGDFTVNEIVARAAKENLNRELRPGVRVYAYLHCVANMAPSPGRYCMLYATGRNTRRLVRQGDEFHPERHGKKWPEPNDIPPEYRYLIDWAKERYGASAAHQERWLENLFQLRGLGKELWKDEDPDEYVRKLREGWN